MGGLLASKRRFLMFRENLNKNVGSVCPLYELIGEDGLNKPRQRGSLAYVATILTWLGYVEYVRRDPYLLVDSIVRVLKPMEPFGSYNELIAAYRQSKGYLPKIDKPRIAKINEGDTQC